jgi:hypothetical protein
MRYMIFVLAGLLPTLICVNADAQIYKSKDADGNTVFTDVPTGDAEEVNLPNTNTADSVEVRSPEPVKQSPDKTSSGQGKSEQGGPVVIGGDNDLRDDIFAEQRRRELHDRKGDEGQGPKHTGTGEPAAKPRPARPSPPARHR